MCTPCPLFRCWRRGKRLTMHHRPTTRPTVMTSKHKKWLHINHVLPFTEHSGNNNRGNKKKSCSGSIGICIFIRSSRSTMAYSLVGQFFHLLAVTSVRATPKKSPLIIAYPIMHSVLYVVILLTGQTGTLLWLGEKSLSLNSRRILSIHHKAVKVAALWTVFLSPSVHNKSVGD